MKIDITCEYKRLIPIDELEDFQGGLKVIDNENLAKIKDSISRFGFSFPVFVWKNKILDGHQRIAAMKSLLEDGAVFNHKGLPVVSIAAANETEAAEKLLLINSRYAEIDQGGFDAFVDAYKINVPDLSGMLTLPDIDFAPANFGDDDDEKLLDQMNPNLHPAEIHVEKYDTYRINDKHIFTYCDLSTDWPHYSPYLTDETDLFFPYASFYIFLSEKAEKHRLVVIQSDGYLFAKMLETMMELNRKEYIQKI